MGCIWSAVSFIGRVLGALLVIAFLLWGLLWGASWFITLPFGVPGISAPTLAPVAQSPGGQSQSVTATPEAEATPQGGAKVNCEVMAFNETWVIIRPEDSINTTLVVLNLDDKSSAYVPYIGTGTGSVIVEVPRKKNLMGAIHFAGGQYGTIVLYDLSNEHTLGRKEVNRDEVDSVEFAENGVLLLFDSEEQELRIDAPTLTSAQRTKYDIRIRLNATPLGRITAEAEAAINRVQLQDGSFCKLS